MSGLAALLAGRVPVGTYLWDGALDAADLRHTVEHAGWQFGYVDGWRCQTKIEVLDAIARTLRFPEHFGRNFDALADCLSDVGADGTGTVLLWDGWGTLARSDAGAFGVALDVLGTRVEDGHGGPLAVLLRGEGPDPVGIPELG